MPLSSKTFFIESLVEDDGEVQLDLSNVQTVANDELEQLIYCALKAHDEGKRLVLKNVDETVYEVLEMTRFVRMAEIRNVVRKPATSRSRWFFHAAYRD